MTALWSAADAAAATGGRALGAWTASGVTFDSRQIAPGDLFVALKGENTDGHRFVADALARGAVAAMVAGPVAEIDLERQLIVSDTMKALEKLAQAARARADVRVVAITGSVGKTGTKDMLRLALGGPALCHASAASYNNQTGVPLSLARMPRDARFGVFEIGMNHAREIAPLVALVRPEVAVVTTVVGAHAEFFADGVDGVAKAKAEIFEAGGRVAVLNRDNKYFAMLAETARRFGFVEIVGFGASPDAAVRLVALAAGADGSDVTASVHGRTLRFRLNVAGAHYAMNALAVLAAAEAVGVAAEIAAARLAEFGPPKGRGTREMIGTPPASFELIDDAYNANPWSMNAAFAVLALARPGPGGRRVAVIGDMRELGADAPALHATLADGIGEHRIDLVYACGPEMAHLWAKLPPAKRGAYAATSTELVAPVREGVRANDVVLIKGSLGTNMAPIVAALRREGSVAAPQARKPA